MDSILGSLLTMDPNIGHNLTTTGADKNYKRVLTQTDVLLLPGDKNCDES